MSSTRLKLRQKAKTFLNKNFPKNKLEQAGFAMAAEEIKIIRERTMLDGVDIDSKRFKKLSDPYRRKKEKLVRGKYKSSSKTYKRAFGGGRTFWVAKGVPNFMRLSGRMFSDMFYTNVKVKEVKDGYRVDYEIDFKTSRSKKIAEGNIKTRNFWGPAKAGTPRRLKENARKEKVFLKKLE